MCHFGAGGGYRCFALKSRVSDMEDVSHAEYTSTPLLFLPVVRADASCNGKQCNGAP